MSYTINWDGFSFTREDFVAYDVGCPICLSGDIRKYSELDGNFNFFFNYCHHCHGVSASHHLTDEATSKYYNEFYKVRDDKHKDLGIVTSTGRIAGTTKDRDDKLKDLGLGTPNYKKVIKQFLPHVSIEKREISILDWGGGSGLMACVAAEVLLERPEIAKVDILVCDFENETVRPVNKNIRVERVRSVEKAMDKFDLVIASAVIEHVNYPHAILPLLFSLVEKGGYFYIRVPYAMPIYKVVKKLKVFSDYRMKFPMHLHDFSPQFFDNIYNTYNISGFTTVFSAPPCVENTFRHNPLMAVLTRLIRFPYLFCKAYPFVGSWAILSHREA